MATWTLADEIDPADVEDGIEYPSEDGEPMGETGYQVDAIYALYGTLQEFYRKRKDVYVAADMFWYWEKGNPSACCAPDVMVLIGVPNEVRRSFRGWNEGGVVPAVVFEMASRRTWRRNLGALYDQYERLGVKEYFLFDPEEKFIRPRLQGFRLRARKYAPIRPDKDGGVVSAQLGMRIVQEGRFLGLTDTRTGEPILAPWERARQERERADRAEQRARELEAELVRLRAPQQPKGKANGRKPTK